ncbi:COG3650 family protein [Vibrio ezurae]|uniref:Lipoprotein n=1 Tax=Vibrio ezurae NBRC 102218 TaxID=1219080 RepID=U3B3D3_9VIBR|nr:hypothetical protein [Vibrio ezurae]GAD80450.1 hypothetical protein VEZ01S_37_00150 [Vibrio ezurae NBRC 102218]
MKKCALLSVISSMVLLGCSSTEPPQSPASTSKSDVLSSQPLIPDPEAPARVLLRGEIMVGHESRTIHPCNSNATYWLELPAPVRTAAESMTTKPNQAMYAEVFGYFEPATSGFAQEFGSKFVVSEFNIITTENRNRCQQAPQEAKAFGNEPSWSAHVTEHAVELSELGKDTLHLPVVNLEQSLNESHYSLTQGQLIIRPQMCRDTMSDSIYGWTAQLHVADRNLTGCYTDSNRTIDPVTGTYRQSLDSSTTLTLTLSADHQAESRYSYNDGSHDVVEQGHWQTLNSDLIQVTSVSYQGQQIIAVRDFELKGDTLSTQYETINGATYPLTNDGLNLKKAL